MCQFKLIFKILGFDESKNIEQTLSKINERYSK
jgi:hypothetical protein